MKKIILSVVILSNTDCDDIYHMNRNCLISLRDSEEWDGVSYEVILVESNQASQYNYGSELISVWGGANSSDQAKRTV